MEFLYDDAIGVAYLLDPRYLGDGMSAQERKKLRKVFSILSPNREKLYFGVYELHDSSEQ
jgi:hypothetical protein